MSDLPVDLRQLVGTASYYLQRRADFVARNPGRPPPTYYTGIGDKYFRRFADLRDELTIAGWAWIEETASHLQRMIEELRERDPAGFARLEMDHDAFDDTLYQMHSQAYQRSGFDDLPLRDVLSIVGEIDAADMLTLDGFEEIAQVAWGRIRDDAWELVQALRVLLGARHHHRRALLAGRLARGGPWPFGRALGTWSTFQAWRDVLFLSWPVPKAAAATLEARLPPDLTLDRFDGTAWVSAVLLRMAHVHGRRLPLTLPSFAQLNLRTYVRCDDHPGLLFLSVDCDALCVARGARRLFHLPYHDAEIVLGHRGERHFSAVGRTDPRAPPARLVCEYRPAGALAHCSAGSLPDFLLERYRFYVFDSRRRRLLQGAVRHRRWRIRDVDLDLRENTLLGAAGLPVLGAPAHVAFSPGLDTFGTPLELAPTARALWHRAG